ncbi:hypothetical protein SLA2020_143120 [Shorea laevis]
MPVGDDTTVVDSNTCVADADLYYFDSDDLSVYDSDMSKDEFMVIKDAVRRKNNIPIFDPKNVIPIFDIGMRFKIVKSSRKLLEHILKKRMCLQMA